ncbi:DUF3391 domain-containing protein [Methylocucumis oryzae]|nr:DUF3391 domain-containing protein [Methylocucumis oryzae]
MSQDDNYFVIESTEQKKKIDVNDLKIGMFVSALDRPWLQTKFFISRL